MLVKRTQLLLCLFVFLLTACDPCTSCGPLFYEPTVELIFTDVEIVNEVKTKVKASDVSIYWEDVMSVVEFDEGISSFETPLAHYQATCDYTITVNGNSYTLSLAYTPEKQLDIDHRVLIRALDIKVSDHSFDSLLIECGTFGCLDNETTITCYF